MEVFTLFSLLASFFVGVGLSIPKMKSLAITSRYFHGAPIALQVIRLLLLMWPLFLFYFCAVMVNVMMDPVVETIIVSSIGW